MVKKKYGPFICNRFIDHIRKIDPHKTITYVVIFDGTSNVHLGGELLKCNYPELTVMYGVEHTVSSFFNYEPKIPILNHTITAHKAIYK